jgi:aspartate/methionine/tyrosine aminotransferase
MGNDIFIKEIGRIHSHVTLCATSFAQFGAIEAYESVYKEVDDMVEEFKIRRDYVSNYLSKIDNISFIEPKGAFYVFFNVERTGMNGTEFCERLLREKGVALAPGSGYGSGLEDYVRLSYACSMDNIIEAMDLMKSFIENN